MPDYPSISPPPLLVCMRGCWQSRQLQATKHSPSSLPPPHPHPSPPVSNIVYRYLVPLSKYCAISLPPLLNIVISSPCQILCNSYVKYCAPLGPPVNSVISFPPCQILCTSSVKYCTLGGPSKTCCYCALCHVYSMHL